MGTISPCHVQIDEAQLLNQELTLQNDTWVRQRSIFQVWKCQARIRL